MKKLFFLLLGLSFLVSCSNDEQITFNDSPSGAVSSIQKEPVLKSATIDTVLKGLYITMINSRSYKDFASARSVFYNKFSTNIPDSELVSADKMLIWISNNISKTGFQNYQEAVDEHENVIALGIAAIQSNYAFHEHLAGAAPGALGPILDEQAYVPNASCKECIKAYNNCVSIANSAYGNAMQEACNSFMSGGIAITNFRQYQNTTNQIYYTLDRDIKMCSMHFEQCCKAA